MLGLTVRGRAFIALIAVLLGALAWGSGRLVASVANRSQAQIKDTQQLSTTLLGEVGAAAFYWISPNKYPYELREIGAHGERYVDALKKARKDLSGDPQLAAALDNLNRLAIAWRKSADVVTGMMDNPKTSVYPTDSLLRSVEDRLNRFGQANIKLQNLISARSRHDTSLANFWSVIGGVGLALLIAIFGELVLVRRTRDEYAYRDAHSDFVDSLVLAKEEGAAYALLTQRLEQLVQPSHVLVVPHDEPIDPDAPPPDYENEQALIEHFKQAHGGNVLDRPLRLGDQMLATVLIERGSELNHTTAAHVNDALAAAAPIIATLDNLADAETLATTDQLTGTANRRALEHSLKHMFAHAARVGEPLAVIMLDIDYFKSFNDNFGHDAGDAVLRELGGVLRDSVRAADVAGRYGGEEFLVLCPAADLSGAAGLAMKLHAAVASIVVNDTRVTASFGVASYPESAPGTADLIKAADQALYRAKENGRDRVELAEESSTVLD